MIWLIFAHFIGDWGLQYEWMALNKNKYWFVMTAHCVIWTACVCIALEYYSIMAYWKVIFLFLGHLLCDIWKCKVYEKVPFCQQKTNIHLYVDQIWHLWQCAIVWMF